MSQEFEENSMDCNSEAACSSDHGLNLSSLHIRDVPLLLSNGNSNEKSDENSIEAQLRNLKIRDFEKKFQDLKQLQDLLPVVSLAEDMNSLKVFALYLQNLQELFAKAIQEFEKNFQDLKQLQNSLPDVSVEEEMNFLKTFVLDLQNFQKLFAKTIQEVEKNFQDLKQLQNSLPDDLQNFLKLIAETMQVQDFEKALQDLKQLQNSFSAVSVEEDLKTFALDFQKFIAETMQIRDFEKELQDLKQLQDSLPGVSKEEMNYLKTFTLKLQKIQKRIAETMQIPDLQFLKHLENSLPIGSLGEDINSLKTLALNLQNCEKDITKTMQDMRDNCRFGIVGDDILEKYIRAGMPSPKSSTNESFIDVDSMRICTEDTPTASVNDLSSINESSSMELARCLSPRERLSSINASLLSMIVNTLNKLSEIYCSVESADY